MTIVPKLWGHEKIIQNNLAAGYCLKELTVTPNGQACSIHYHKKKTETFYVIKGNLYIERYRSVEDCPDDCGTPHDREVYRLSEGDILTLLPYTPHRFWAMGGDAVFIEGSSPDYSYDSYRIIPAGPIPSDIDYSVVPRYPSAYPC